MIKVSIIIPVYNVEKFLGECLDSVINQTLRDIEIICINDCSTDDSLRILKEYASKDNRIKIIEQKVNQGQGVARNTAIKVATGEYIGFIDPDDWIEADMYEKMYNKAKEFDTDIAICNIEKFYNNSSFKQIINPIKKCSDIDKSIKTGAVYNLNHLHKYYLSLTNNYAWCRIYKNEFLKQYDIRFSSVKIGEDKLFCCLAKFLAQKIIHIDEPFYHYRQHRKQQTLANKQCYIIWVELLNEFCKYPLSDDTIYGIDRYLAHMAQGEFKKSVHSTKDRLKLYQKAKAFLPYNSFHIFKPFAISFIIKQFFRGLLSTKNVVEDGTIYKYLCILGFRFKLHAKHTQPQV